MARSEMLIQNSKSHLNHISKLVMLCLCRGCWVDWFGVFRTTGVFSSGLPWVFLMAFQGFSKWSLRVFADIFMSTLFKPESIFQCSSWWISRSVRDNFLFSSVFQMAFPGFSKQSTFQAFSNFPGSFRGFSTFRSTSLGNYYSLLGRADQLRRALTASLRYILLPNATSPFTLPLLALWTLPLGKTRVT